MGVEIPTVQLEERPPVLCYGLTQTNSKLDAAYMCFHEAKRMSAKLAEVENSVYRLATRSKRRRSGKRKHIWL